MILFFIAIFFNHQEFDHYESGCGAKKKKKISVGLVFRRCLGKNNLQAYRILTSSKVILENECQTHRD